MQMLPFIIYRVCQKRCKYALLLSCLIIMPSFAMAQSEAQMNKQRKKWREIIHIVDSIRYQLRQSADKGRMLQWGDSILVAELQKSKMSDKKKARFMKHYGKLQKRLALYDKRLFWVDSLLAAKYNKVTFDTAYITRPKERWTVKMLGNLSGADIRTNTKEGGVAYETKVMADFRGTLSMAVAYRGMGLSLSVNPAKLAGKNKDYELNLNSYSNRYGFDVVYLASKTYHGHMNLGSGRIDIPKGMISQNALNLNFYYVFNSRRFSFPVAFSQSYVQKRSAGSLMVGASFDGSKTVVGTDVEHPSLQPITIRLNEFAVGAGYGYNLVAGKHLLFHLSALPTITVYSHDYTESATEMVDEDGQLETTTVRNRMNYHFPSAIVTGRGAALYSWRNKFAGATAVYNFSVAGDEEHLQLKRNKWRVKMFFGFRF